MRPNGQMKSKEVGHGERTTINSDTGSSQITLKRTSIVDSGYYICFATVNIDQSNSGYCYLQLMCKFYFITCTFLANIRNQQSVRKFFMIVIAFMIERHLTHCSSCRYLLSLILLLGNVMTNSKTSVNFELIISIFNETSSHVFFL